MMATQSSLQDCYFYFYSSCTKGDECPFRHCELALGTETVCSLWREGRCFRSNCKFRHMESRINRSTIPCYWENQPGGCRKPHCVFMHRKLRNGTQAVKDAPGLILPTSDGKTSPKHQGSSEISSLPNPLPEKVVECDADPDPSLTPVPPLVLSFDEGEESDTESVTSTPVKQGDKKAAPTRNNLSVKASGSAEEKDFVIKTLEQIRMEKIHKESDSFYGAAYATTPLDTPRLIEQHYPPKAEFLALPKDNKTPLDKSLPAPIKEPKLSGVDEETDLRDRLLSRRSAPLNKVNQAKRLISFKKQNGSQMEVDSNKLDFKIKTLEEIRKERENKQSKSEVALDSSPDALPSSEEKKPLNNTKQKTFRKLKIHRKPKELYSVPARLQQDVGAPSSTIITATHSITNGVKISSPKSSEESSDTPVFSRDSSDSSPGKRKSDDDLCSTVSKIMKTVTTLEDGRELVNAPSDRTGENHEEYLQKSPSTAKEISNTSSPVHNISTSFNLSSDKVVTAQSSVPDVEMNGVTTSDSVSLSSPNHKPDGKSSEENERGSKNESSAVLLTPAKSNPSSDDGAGKDNLIDRSMSVDAELDELLGDDDMNIDEIDATPNDDILLEIEEFLES